MQIDFHSIHLLLVTVEFKLGRHEPALQEVCRLRQRRSVLQYPNRLRATSSSKRSSQGSSNPASHSCHLVPVIARRNDDGSSPEELRTP